MVSVLDVARYILEQRGPMSAMKLQKLCYYSQAWHLVWEDGPLFGDQIEAWAFGPVIPVLYEQHRGQFSIAAEDIRGDASTLSKRQTKLVDAILDSYGEKSAHWLSELSHREAPWKDARGDLAPEASSTREISQASMREYYEALTSASGATPVREMAAD